MSRRVFNTVFIGLATTWGAFAFAQSSIGLTQVQVVDFGVIPAGTTRCSMNIHATLNGNCIGTGIPGQIEVTGSPHFAYNVSVSSVGWVNDMTFRPGLNAKKFSLDAQGRSSFTVTGEVRFKPNFTQSGTFVLPYTISVYYQ